MVMESAFLARLVLQHTPQIQGKQQHNISDNNTISMGIIISTASVVILKSLIQPAALRLNSGKLD